LKGDAVVGLCEIYIALARFIQRRLSFTVVDSVAAFRFKLGANDLNCVGVPLNPTHYVNNFGEFHYSHAFLPYIFTRDDYDT